jgi:phosphoglycolate phosphatase
MSQVKLIVFDCDGTLVDSQYLIVSAMQRAFLGEGLLSPERASILHTVGLSIPEAVRALAPDAARDVQLRLCTSYRDWCFSFRQQSPATEPLFNGASNLLRKLADRPDVLLGVATGKSRRGVHRLIEAEGLQGIFATIQTADDAPSKPHPAMLHAAMAETGAEACHTYMIGDTVFDVAMALSAGATPIAVSWGYHAGRELRKAGAAHLVRSFGELDMVIERATSRGSLVAAE